MKAIALAILVYFIVGVLLDVAYAILTNDVPWYHWRRAIRVGLVMTALSLFAAYVWPVVTK